MNKKLFFVKFMRQNKPVEHYYVDSTNSREAIIKAAEIAKFGSIKIYSNEFYFFWTIVCATDNEIIKCEVK